MALQYPPFAVWFLISTVAAVLIGGFSLRRRDTPGAVPLAVIMAAGAFWTVAYLLELAMTGYAAKLFWWQAKYLGIAVLPTAFLVYALEYAGYDEWITRRTLALLSVVPVLQVAVVWTNSAHHLFVGPPSLATSTGFVRLMTPIEPGFWLFAGYQYLLLLAGAAVFLRLFLVADDLYRGQAVGILVGVVAPFIANLLFLFDLIPVAIDLTPVAFTVTGVAFAWAVFRHDLLDIVPITRELAREELIASIADATFVVDEQRRVVDLNPAARSLVATDGSPLGEPIDRVRPEVADLFDALEPEAEVQRKVKLELPDGPRFFDAQVTSLAGRFGVLRGHVLILRDITALERNRQRLEVMNRVLRHDIRTDVNLILAYAAEALDGTADPADRLERIKDKAWDITELSDHARELEQTLDPEAVHEPIDLVVLVESYLDDVREDYLDVEFPTDLPERAVASASPLMDSALRNLVRNAIEHNDRDTPEVAIDVRNRDGRVELRVSDNGPGLPPAEREVIERGTETGVSHSSGLGLWLINWIVTASGGEIRFEANEPRGTVITLSLPMADDAAVPRRNPGSRRRGRGDS